MKTRKGIKNILREKANEGFETGMAKAIHSEPHVTIMTNSVMLIALAIGFSWLYMDGPDSLLLKLFLMICAALVIWTSARQIIDAIAKLKGSKTLE